MVFPLNAELSNPSLPVSPKNGFVGYVFSERNALDIIWNDPAQNPFNSNFSILGTNIYRSYDSELGPFTLITPTPLTVSYYRDTMTHTEVTEDVSASFIFKGDSPDKQDWCFTTANRIVKNDRELIYANHAEDVEITIDGNVVPAAKVNGYDCKVWLVKCPYIEKHTRNVVNPILPTDTSVVTCKYKYNTNHVTLERNQRIFYKLTTVSTTGESDINHVTPISVWQIEAWDYIWKEAVRRNRWILQQGGENCWVYLRKWVGQPCDTCYDKTYERAQSDCMVCYGTGIVGGFVGPYDFLMAPVDVDTTLTRQEQGLKVVKTGTQWTNMAPKLGTYDLIFRKSGEIYIVGKVHMSEVRGNAYLQQEFDISLLPRDRIEYQLFYPPAKDVMFVSEKPNIDDGEETRGRTVVFENIS